MLLACREGRVKDALDAMKGLWDLGYSALDLVTTVFKVVKAQDMPEQLKLDMVQVISSIHLRVADGVGTLLQMQGMCARLCELAAVRR
jgi:replication factor C subunit 2/4